MPNNVTFSSGNVALIDKIDSETTFFTSILGGVGGRSRSFIPCVKLLISNKLNQSGSVNKILDFTPAEQLTIFGFEGKASDRSLYRVLERLGERQPVILDQFQQWICHQDLVDPTQMLDFVQVILREPNVRWGSLDIPGTISRANSSARLGSVSD